MESLEQIRDRILLRFPGAGATIVPNPSPSAQHSLLLETATAVQIATWLRDDPELRLDYCSNVTGVDWPVPAATAATKAAPPPTAVMAEVFSPATLPLAPSPLPRAASSHLEVVYHLFSMTKKHGPVVLRVRTVNRTDQATVPSLTPVWRSCEFQEREVFDLFGVVFEGHPDLRRILMWDAFKDHPMRKDYVEPDDYEWEPTPHGDVLAKAAQHAPATVPDNPPSPAT